MQEQLFIGTFTPSCVAGMCVKSVGHGANCAAYARKNSQRNEERIYSFCARSGDKGWSLLRHQVLRHAITPALCLQFASLGELMGALLAEKVFAYPGLGQATIDAGLRGDVPLLMGIVLFCTLLVFAGNTISAWLVVGLNRSLERPDAL